MGFTEIIISYFEMNSSYFKRLAKNSMLPLYSTSLPTEWELDLCSRPILNARGKKIWELLVTDSKRSFVFSEFYQNNMINSVRLKESLEKFLRHPGTKRPERCLFFRSQMQIIISRALSDLEIKPVPSRRCLSIMYLLEERIDTVYKKSSGYIETNTTAYTFEKAIPRDLPDALRGEQWTFIQLSASKLEKETQKIEQKKIFGSKLAFNVITTYVKSKTYIPGVAVFSSRAVPLAAWTNCLEIAALSADIEKSSLVLETGIDQRWKYGSYRRSESADQEALAWEIAKKTVHGIHFLAILPEPDSEPTGLWVMQDRKMPII